MGHQTSKLYFIVTKRAHRKTTPLPAKVDPLRRSPPRPPPPPRQRGFKWIEGRGYRYGVNPKYMLPTDWIEGARLNSRHHQLRAVFDSDYQAPITEELEQGIKVLDVGCGTGIWSVEMATQFTASTFVGSDITDTFEGTVAPPNCTFVCANTVKGLPFETDHFDYVFMRSASLCFTRPEWPKVITELVRVTKPGGTIELVDEDFWVYNAGPSTKKICKQYEKILKQRDIDTTLITHLNELLSAAGLSDITHEHRSVGVGWGPSELGPPFKENLVAIFKACIPISALALGLARAQVDQTIDAAENELNDKQRSFVNIDLYIATKPVSLAADEAY